MRTVPLSVTAIFLAWAVAVFASGPSFKPDGTFSGSTLKGWHTLGHAKWNTETGSVTGMPSDTGGRWLLHDSSFQDISLYTEFRCDEGCETGVLLRAEKTP